MGRQIDSACAHGHITSLRQKFGKCKRVCALELLIRPLIPLEELEDRSVYMYTYLMKFQVTLPDDFAEEARTVSARLQIPLAQFIRDSMQQRLNELRMGKTGKQRFLDRFSGVIDTGETDLASRVDELLYGDTHE